MTLEANTPFHWWGQLASTGLPFGHCSLADQSQLALVPSSVFFLSDHDVYYNFGLLNLFFLTTIYYKTTHLLTRGNISLFTSLGDFTRMSHCLKLDPLCLISLLRFYGFGALFPSKYIAAILIGIELQGFCLQFISVLEQAQSCFLRQVLALHGLLTQLTSSLLSWLGSLIYRQGCQTFCLLCWLLKRKDQPLISSMECLSSRSLVEGKQWILCCLILNSHSAKP